MPSRALARASSSSARLVDTPRLKFLIGKLEVVNMFGVAVFGGHVEVQGCLREKLEVRKKLEKRLEKKKKLRRKLSVVEKV